MLFDIIFMHVSEDLKIINFTFGTFVNTNMAFSLNIFSNHNWSIFLMLHENAVLWSLL